RFLAHLAVAAPGVVRLRPALFAGGTHRLAKPDRRRHVRLIGREHAAVRDAPTRVRPGDEFGPIRGDARGCDRIDHILLGRLAGADRDDIVRTLQAMQIRRAIPTDRDALFDVWLRSVRATHTFLSEADIQSFMPLVRDYLASDAEFWVLCS